jgi:hypothetical protein
MRVDHRRADIIAMAEQFLYGSYIVAIFQQSVWSMGANFQFHRRLELWGRCQAVDERAASI